MYDSANHQRTCSRMVEARPFFFGLRADHLRSSSCASPNKTEWEKNNVVTGSHPVNKPHAPRHTTEHNNTPRKTKKSEIPTRFWVEDGGPSCRLNRLRHKFFYFHRSAACMAKAAVEEVLPLIFYRV